MEEPVESLLVVGCMQLDKTDVYVQYNKGFQQKVEYNTCISRFDLSWGKSILISIV